MSVTAKGKSRPRVYYGWVIVAVLALAGVVQTGQFNPTLGVFIKPVTEEFGWDRSVFVGAVSLGTLAGGLTAVFIGPLLDRFGPRWIVSGGLLLIGGGMVSMYFVTQVWQFYLAMVVGRMAVQGAINLGISVSVSKWFVRKRSRAMAVTTMGVRIGNGVSPLYSQALVSSFGWRSGFLAFGVLSWAVALLPAALFLRRRPEDLGLRPDGDEPEERQGEPGLALASQHATEETSFSLREVLRTKVFYVLMFVTSVISFGLAAVNLNMVAYLGDRGLEADKAVAVVTVWSFVGIAGSLLVGFIGDKLRVRPLLAASLGGMALNILFLLRVNSLPLAFTFAVCYGMVFGCMATLVYLTFPAYYGRASLGAIQGVTTPVQMGANALGPLTAALVFDTSNSYSPIFLGVSAFLALASLALWLAPSPRKAARAGG